MSSPRTTVARPAPGTWRSAAAWLAVAILSGLAAGPARAEEGTIELKEALVLRPAGRSGRSPIHVDPVEARLVAGRWSPPSEGDAVSGPGAAERRWEAIRAGGDGRFQHPALGGGYADIAVESGRSRVMILDASGHDMVYVRGEPRAGDPYGHGICRLPVRLDEGTNHLLFHAGRGSLRARLVAPRAEAQLDTADATLPDLIVGRPSETWGAVVVLNATEATATALTIRASVAGGPESEEPVPPIPMLGTRKVAFRIKAAAPEKGGEATLRLRLVTGEKELDRADLKLSVAKPEEAQKRTFRSGIDGSIQYFAVVPAAEATDGTRPGLILTLHGAAVEAIGQARCYRPRTWAHIVAPTNRRPFGFDWEDWGRLDALEVLEAARAQLDPDPSRTYLTGHSMGGHGTWQIGLSFPGLFAAIAPSAGWVSMWSYAGARRIEDDSPIAGLLRRASRPSDTLALAENAKGLGIYVLHGDADDNVPVGQARTMRKVLGEFHPDFTYYERPGAGHWWGNECMDWPPLMDFLQRHTIAKAEDVRRVDFVTINPGISARRDWATIEDQVARLEPSAVHLAYDRDRRRFSGSTANVARLRLDLGHVPKGKAVEIELDGHAVAGLDGATGGDPIWLERRGEEWAAIDRPSPSRKGPDRFGPFKEAFRHRFLYVYGTRGSPEEDARALAKARFDAETFWYRGNGSVDVVPDSAFDPRAEPDRDVILVGNAETNGAWTALLGDGPVQVHRDRVTVGDRQFEGEDLACLVLRPRPGSDSACVAAVAGTGVVGLRLTERLPYFNSGVGYPDCLVLGAEVLEKGLAGVRAAGYFGSDWGVASGEFAWRDGSRIEAKGPGSEAR